jgi:hypothetical protein
MCTFSRSLLCGPASIRRMRTLLSSASLPATTQPEVPPPLHELIFQYSSEKLCRSKTAEAHTRL